MLRHLNIRVTLLGENPSHRLTVIESLQIELLPLSAQAKVFKKAETFAPCNGHYPTELGAKIVSGFQFAIHCVSCQWSSSYVLSAKLLHCCAAIITSGTMSEGN